jgi:acetyltransferase-like isoleucine patch superfamily enzyme
MKKNVVIHRNVKIGKDPTIEDFTILGKPPRGVKPGQLELILGDFPIIRSGTVIYAGNTIGDHFQTGDNTRIRENNKIGNNVSIGGGSVVEGKCSIEDNVRIHSNCFISEYTCIESNAWIGPGVIMTNVLHPPCPAFKKKAPLWGKKCCCGPIIKKFAVIGAGAIILPGVVIDEKALVGAGAIVTEDVPAAHVVSGFPARITKKVEELDCPLGLYAKGEVYSWRKK